MTLEQLRAAAGLTQPELASKVGVTLGTIASWEGGVTAPRAYIIRKLADALGASITDVYTAIEETRRQKQK